MIDKKDRLAKLEAAMPGICWLDDNEAANYARALVRIARTAIDSRCGTLRVVDVETVTALEDKGEAVFTEWLHAATNK